MTYWQQAGILAGCLIAAGVALLMVVVCLKNRQGAARRDRGVSSDAEGIRADIRELTAELDALAGRIDKRIEQRLDELRRLVSEVDAKVAEAEAKLRGLDGPGGSYKAAPPAAADAEESPPTGRTRPKAGAKISPQHQEVLALKAQGLNAVEIARRVAMNVGEVELVLNLHQSRSRAY